VRQLSDSLLDAQKRATHTPYVKVEAKNTVCDVVRLDWERLYNGNEDDYFHDVTLPADGSLIRVRVTPPGDSRKLYRQRVTNPGTGSDFSQWIYTSQYNVVDVACCSLGAEVSIFWIKSDCKIYHLKSVDYGASWGSPQLLDYAPTTAIYGIAAAYKANGDIALFFADQATIYVMKRIGGNWQSKVAWDKSTGDLSGVAAVYDSDWCLMVSGKDENGNYKLWSLVYGDGGDVDAGDWSNLRTVASAPSDGDFEYFRIFMDNPDVSRCFFVEKFSGIDSYSRPFWSCSVSDSVFTDNCWREPIPMNLSSEYGLAIAHNGDYCWLSAPYGVWRTGLVPDILDITGDILSLKQEQFPGASKLNIELRNNAGKYSSLGQGELAVLDIGCQLDFSSGYLTGEGNEVSSGQSFILEAYERTTTGQTANLRLYTADAWSLVKNWRARCQFRWNKDNDESSVKEILAFILSRVGLKLEVKSQSAVIMGYYPDFTIHPGNRGNNIITRLLSFVPDIIFIEGSKAYLVCPLSSDVADYSYGEEHRILEGTYRWEGWGLNRVQVEGYDTQSGEMVLVDCFAWEQVDRPGERLKHLEDVNIDTVLKAELRGDAYLRHAEIESSGGAIRIPVNCGQ